MAYNENTHLELDSDYDKYDYPVSAPNPQSGHPGHTTPEQDDSVYQLRKELKKAEKPEGLEYEKRLDTLTLLRFLRARKFNVDLSKQMFIECEKWRKEFGGGVDKLTQTFNYEEKPLVFAYYPQYYHKTDKDGRPLYIEKLGKIDLEMLRNITTDDRMLQNLVVEYEKLADPRLPACSRNAGCLLETCCTVMDLSGVGFNKVSSVYEYVQRASAISQNYYPERLGRLYLINAPWGFSTVFSIVKRYLDPVTVAKIHILGGNYKDELLKQIPAENLPSEFNGGKCKCPGGCALSDEGPWKKKDKAEQDDEEENAEKAKWLANNEKYMVQNRPQPPAIKEYAASIRSDDGSKKSYTPSVRSVRSIVPSFRKLGRKQSYESTHSAMSSGR